MGEKQAAFEYLTVSDFMTWSSIALKTFNSSAITMHCNCDKIKIS